MNGKKVILIIMDGWGEGAADAANAIYQADAPFFRGLHHDKTVAYNTLDASGLAVGLPEGQMGNSEVGHLNFGAGRVVYQDLVRINLAIADDSIRKNPALNEAFAYAKAEKKAVHLIGLISDGGVHSEQEHVAKLCQLAQDAAVDKVFIHAIMDGRDTDPHGGLGYMKRLQEDVAQTGARVATVVGRYYTMDRDRRWERVKVGYDMMVEGVGRRAQNAQEAIKASYNEGVTDEFILPIVLEDAQGAPMATIAADDVVICCNFRTDRLREITKVLTQQDMPEAGMRTIPLYYVTMTRYDDTFKDIHIVFDHDDLQHTLGEEISKAGKRQLRIAETEKYPHVTFFFSGGRELPFEGEERIMVASPKVATYDMQPQMSAEEVTEKVVEALDSQRFDFICLNFANADMVGHTGVMEAILAALKAVDGCTQRVVDCARRNGYTVLVTADHGNSEHVRNADGTPNTAHTCNPVPCFLLDDDFKTLRHGRLADVAPTILKLMDIEVPEAMTGTALV